MPPSHVTGGPGSVSVVQQPDKRSPNPRMGAARRRHVKETPVNHETAGWVVADAVWGELVSP